MDDAAERLVTDLRGALVGALALYTGEEAVAEDLAQEAFARMVERWDRVAVMDNPRGWVYRVAFNLARSRFTRLGTERRVLRLLGAGERGRAPAPSDPADAIGLAQAVRALPPRQRAAILCRYYADLSVAETAVALGCAEGTVKSLTSQGVAALRRTDLLPTTEPEVHR